MYGVTFNIQLSVATIFVIEFVCIQSLSTRRNSTLTSLATVTQLSLNFVKLRDIGWFAQLFDDHTDALYKAMAGSVNAALISNGIT